MINKTDWKLYEIFLLSFLLIAYTFSCWALEDKFFLVKFWSWSMILLIYAFFRLQKHIIMFAPLNLFCLYYITIPITNFYYISTDFESAVFLNKNALQHSYIYLFNMSAFYYFIGLASMLLGYITIRKPSFKPIIFESNRTINPYILKFVIFIMLLIGIFNFSYNVFVNAGGNLFAYLATVAARKDEFEATGGTTLGYNFFYMATYLLIFSYMRKKKKINWFLIITILTGVLLKASSGRIYQTLAYFLSLVAIFYINDFLNENRTNNRKYIKLLLPLPILGVGFYFLRMLSSISIGGMSNDSIWDLAQSFTKVLGYFAFDKGNTPNVALFMKIIDAWQNNHGYLYGKSLFSGVLKYLPRTYEVSTSYISSFMVRDLWYPDIQGGGALPTTAVGEMYMNFGPLGPFIGMFVVGFFIKIWYVFVIKSRNYWQYFAFLLVSIVFITIYPKVDCTNLDPLDLVFVFFPLFIVWLTTNLVNLKIFDSQLGLNKQQIE